MNDFVDTLLDEIEHQASIKRQKKQFRIIVALFVLVIVLNLLGRLGVI